MKRLYVFFIPMCIILLLCSCRGKNEQADVSHDVNDSAAANNAMSVDELEGMRVVWEGVLYAAHEYDTESSEFRAAALCYSLTHYGYGNLSVNHADDVKKDVSVTREQIQKLCKVTFGEDAVLSDDEASAFFDIDGDLFRVKQDVSFKKGEYKMGSIFMTGDRVVCSFKTDEKTVAMKFTFALSTDEDLPYRLRISGFEDAE